LKEIEQTVQSKEELLLAELKNVNRWKFELWLEKYWLWLLFL